MRHPQLPNKGWARSPTVGAGWLEACISPWGPCSDLLSAPSSDFVSLKLLVSLRLCRRVLHLDPSRCPPTVRPAVPAETQALPCQCLEQSVAAITLGAQANPSWPIPPSRAPNSPHLTCLPPAPQRVRLSPLPRPLPHRAPDFSRHSVPRRGSPHELSRALATGRPLVPGFMAISTLGSHGRFTDLLPQLLGASRPSPPAQPAPRMACPAPFSTLFPTPEKAGRESCKPAGCDAPSGRDKASASASPLGPCSWSPGQSRLWLLKKSPFFLLPKSIPLSACGGCSAKAVFPLRSLSAFLGSHTGRHWGTLPSHSIWISCTRNGGIAQGRHQHLPYWCMGLNGTPPVGRIRVCYTELRPAALGGVDEGRAGGRARNDFCRNGDTWCHCWSGFPGFEDRWLSGFSRSPDPGIALEPASSRGPPWPPAGLSELRNSAWRFAGCRQLLSHTRSLPLVPSEGTPCCDARWCPVLIPSAFFCYD